MVSNVCCACLTGWCIVKKKIVAYWSIVKSKIVGRAIRDIGMGRYNWRLFVLCGFGWFADRYAC